MEKKRETEEVRRKQMEEKERKREAKIAEKEAERARKATEGGGKKGGRGVKYSKRDVLELKNVFDTYDESRDGKVSLKEFTAALHKNKKQVGVGVKSTREERRAAEGISLADLGESVFHEMDIDGSGEVTFNELLKLMYPYATATELEVMSSWVAAEPEPEPEPEPELTAAQRAELKQMFNLYDKDKSGEISKSELQTALLKTGLSKDEIKELFEQAIQPPNPPNKSVHCAGTQNT